MPSPRPPLFRRAPHRPFGRRIAAATTCAALVAGAAISSIALPATAAIVPSPIALEGSGSVELTPLGTYETGAFDEAAAEIVAFNPLTDNLFVVNALDAVVEVLDLTDPTAPAPVGAIDVAGVVDAEGTTIPATAVANSVAVRADGLVVIAVENDPKTDEGWVVVADGTQDVPEVLGAVRVGPQPDMVALTPDGSSALTADEGEPNDDYDVDPVGSISVIALPSGLAAPAQTAVRTAGFGAFEDGGSIPLPAGVRVFAGIDGDRLPVSRSLEPEYITVSADGATAYASLQEANAIAVVDVASATVTEILPLGVKDHSLPGNALTTSDQAVDRLARSTQADVVGLYMPDTLASYSVGGESYLVSANEGDAREWGEYAEPSRVSALAADGLLCENFDGRTAAADLGRLNVSTESGFDDVQGCYSELHAFGARSFSIWSTEGDLVFDSGDDLERITAEAGPAAFNVSNDNNTLGNRNDDKGPEPEAVAVGAVDGAPYAFVGLERTGGVAVYDISDPTDAVFATYINNRDAAADVTTPAAGDLGPESIAFISASDSPTGVPMIAVGNEISGSTTLYSVSPQDAPADGTTTIQVLGLNDFHGRLEANGAEAGAAVIAGAVNQLRTENPNTIFASAGDMIGASTFTSFSQQDTPTIDALVAAGLDVGAVGNHEFDAGFADLTDRVLPRYGGTRFGLGANVYEAGTETPALDEYWLTEIDGVRVGVIGTVTEQTASLVSPAGIADIEFGDPVEAANRVAARLSNGDDGDGEADVIISLVHEGPNSTDCATIGAAQDAFGSVVRDSSADIDAIISGHTHLVVDCAFPVPGSAGERPVIMAGQYGTHLGQLELEVDTATLEVTGVSRAVIPLAPGGTAAFPADAGVAAIVADAVAAANVVGNTVIGSITGDITRARAAGGAEDRGSESSLGNLVADIQLWATSNDSFAGEPAQIALMNPGGIRADLLFGADGETTYREVASVQPFANTLFTQDLTGAQLKQVLEEQWQPDGSSRPKLHLGISEGFEYVYDASAPRGERIVEMLLNGETIASDDVIRVAANSFLANGGDNFATLAQGTNRTDTGQVDLAAAVAYFEEFEVVEPAPLGRAIVGTDDWASVSLRLDGLRAGDTVPVTVSGLEPGQTITGTLFSDPIDLGTAAANADGIARLALVIPRDLTPGTHTLEIASSVPGELPIRVTLQIAAAPAAAGAGGILQVTGAAETAGILALALGLLGAGGAVLVLRRRASRSLVTVAGE